jgi:hypothetical protein
MAINTRNAKRTDTQKLNKGPFAKFVNRKNEKAKAPAPIEKSKSTVSTNTK